MNFGILISDKDNPPAYALYSNFQEVMRLVMYQCCGGAEDGYFRSGFSINELGLIGTLARRSGHVFFFGR